jgi:hypothetical protein
MKNTFSAVFKVVLFLFMGAGLLPGCQPGEDGPPGPQGTTGTAGPKGATGVKGPDGGLLPKAGTVTGTVAGQRADGSALNESYTLEYSSGPTPATITKTGSGYLVFFSQYDSLQNAFLRLVFETDPDFKNPKLTDAGFSLRQRLENGEYALHWASLYYVRYNTTYTNATITGTVSNVVYDAASGLLTGNYAWQVDNTRYNESGPLDNGSYYYVNYANQSGSQKPLQLTGTFRIPSKVRSYRVRAQQ